MVMVQRTIGHIIEEWQECKLYAESGEMVMNNDGNKSIRDLLKIYFIMGSANCKASPELVLKQAIQGGITIFQYREKGDGALEGKDKLELAQKLKHICQAHKVPFIVNDDVELALEVDADGLHIGQDDGPVDAIRERMGNKILGISVHTLAEADEAIKYGADYFGVGPIFPTNTKTDTEPVQGVSFIAKLRAKGYNVPIVGIGGIKTANAASVTEAGADGVSVITAITHSENITAEVQKLSEEVTKGLDLASFKK